MVRIALGGLYVALGVDGALKRLYGQMLAVSVGSWNPLQRSSQVLNSVEHSDIGSDQGLGEMFMPELGRVQDHQRTTEIWDDSLATVLLQ